jgi:hypothetical protein
MSTNTGLLLDTTEPEPKRARRTSSFYGDCPVLRIDKETGKVLEEYPSPSEAAKRTGIYIGHVLTGRQKTAGGFVFRYKYDEDRVRNKNKRNFGGTPTPVLNIPVLKLDTVSGKLLEEFPSITEAANAIGVDRNQLASVLKQGIAKEVKGFLFQYKSVKKSPAQATENSKERSTKEGLKGRKPAIRFEPKAGENIMAPSSNSSTTASSKKKNYSLNIPSLAEALQKIRPDLTFTHQSLCAIQAAHASFLQLIASELGRMQDDSEQQQQQQQQSSKTIMETVPMMPPMIKDKKDIQQAMERVGFGALFEQAQSYLDNRTTADSKTSKETVTSGAASNKKKSKKRKRKRPAITQEMIDEQERLLAQSKQTVLNQKEQQQEG